ncbi:hypothetical protein PFICI_00071 [Pestalotiopsis fici W106-1]|uniref:BTB domain-containing protein n=1 Tax=Pestalotiopsis fici (strain W106-1 / CGMCC3.15140) TaxID=1229662 RepID=W3XJP7_PESFW|nr:uncharacterized protein PFICI_00071 [Pestalotiopsis fici W106-1]ETS86243.1 hypothetical protein PFICI_00071 [Pestalotiopsis fici W106-1]
MAATDIVSVDPKGDVILQVNASPQSTARSFLVSSKVLCLASDYFVAMFNSRFAEGRRLQEEACPTITLEEDDPNAMHIILRLLHHQHHNIELQMDPELLASVAIHCDKYQCHQTLRPWAVHWCASCSKVSASEDLGYLLLAAHLFRVPNFSQISAQASRHLQPEFGRVWKQHNVLQRLPDTLIGIYLTNTYYMPQILTNLQMH